MNDRRTLYALAYGAAVGLALYVLARIRAASLTAAAAAGGSDAAAQLAPANPSVLDSILNALDSVGQGIGVTVPVGIRNNNPGNLRYVAAINWQGQLGADAHGYAVFDTPAHGVRALAHQLLTYNSRGLNSVRAIISTWAPPSENDTGAYIADVAAELQTGADVPLNVPAVLPQLAAAIIRHENGQQPYNPADLAAWVNL